MAIVLIRDARAAVHGGHVRVGGHLGIRHGRVRPRAAALLVDDLLDLPWAHHLLLNKDLPERLMNRECLLIIQRFTEKIAG